MDAQKMRAWLALILVGGFSLLSFLTVGLVVVGFLHINDGIEILKAFASLYSGFVGIVVGYYFSKNSESKK